MGSIGHRNVLVALVLPALLLMSCTPAGGGAPADSTRGARPAAPTLRAAAPGTGERVFRIVPEQSQASYEAREKHAIAPLSTRAVAHTRDIQGEVVLAMGDVPRLVSSRFLVDLRTLTSELGETPLAALEPIAQRRGLSIVGALAIRDEAIRGCCLESNKYPFAEFTATALQGLPARYTEGEEVSVQIVGDMTIRETTRPVSFNTRAALQGHTLTGTATARFNMTDFGVRPPSSLGLSVEDPVTVIVQLTAVAASAGG